MRKVQASLSSHQYRMRAASKKKRRRYRDSTSATYCHNIIIARQLCHRAYCPAAKETEIALAPTTPFRESHFSSILRRNNSRSAADAHYHRRFVYFSDESENGDKERKLKTARSAEKKSGATCRAIESFSSRRAS